MKEDLNSFEKRLARCMWSGFDVNSITPEAISLVKKSADKLLSSLWHDASEKSLKPLGTKVLALFDDGALVELSIVDMNDIGGVVKYAYIEDLLPSDLTGIK